MIKTETGLENPKILIFDIETSPIIGYVWGLWEQNVIEVIEPWFMLSFSYEWFGTNETHVVSLPDFKDRYANNKKDDFELVLALRNLMDQADIVIAHNGDEFDIRKANSRFIYHGMTPPSPFVSVDTKKLAKKYFKFESNSLKDLAKLLGVPEKMETGGFSLWPRCMAGDMDAWAKMCKYNKQDVVTLREIYKRLRPWHKTHPNVAHIGDIACPKCGSTHVQRRGYTPPTHAGTRYIRVQCNSCGGWSQHRKLEAKTELK